MWTHCPSYAGARAMACAMMLIFATLDTTSGQEMFSRGQNLVPAYDGWQANPDGTIDLVFGYLNRNYEERLHIPVGPNNFLEPGGLDQGQPTYFFPRRHRYVFRIRVPKHFGSKEVVWTITARGKTEKAYASLRPEYVLDDENIMADIGGFAYGPGNKRPVITLEGQTQRTVSVGEPLSLVALASDDGLPNRSRSRANTSRDSTSRDDSAGTGGRVAGLRVTWSVFRGPGDTVTFNPEQKIYPYYKWPRNAPPPPVPPDGKFPVNVRFSAPGTFVVQALASDGALSNTQAITVTVKPSVR